MTLSLPLSHRTDWHDSAHFPDKNGRFGRFGGRYVPEGLMGALLQLDDAYHEARADREFHAELTGLLEHRIGRPTSLHPVENLSAQLPGEVRVYLKREDLAYTGAYKINNALGQVLLARRMGKTRILAETGSGQHGVAVATVCRMFGLECIVYMGEYDMDRQRHNVLRMQMLGAEVRGVSHGGKVLKDAITESVRDWVANLDTTYFAFGTVTGPAPYPQMVRDFQAVMGIESRTEMLRSEGCLPDVVVASVGGGSGAVGMFHAFLDDPEVRLVAVEAAGYGVETGAHAASLGAGSPGEIDGCFSCVVQDSDGQFPRTHSIAAGLNYPAVGPELAYLRELGKVTARSATDAVALRGMRALCQTEGILPSLEAAHALGEVIRMAEGGEFEPGARVLVCLSGSGEKDMEIAAPLLGIG